MPMRRHTSSTLWGSGSYFTLFGSASMPFTETLSPSNIMSLLENSHFSLTVSPTFWNLWRTQCSLLLCSCLSCHTPEHHQHDRSHLQSPPASVTFCANAMPNGSLLNWNLAKGVMNVLSSRDSIVRGICQNPEWASSFVKVRHLSSSPMFGLLLGEYDVPFCCFQGCEVYTYSGRLISWLISWSGYHNNTWTLLCRFCYIGNDSHVFHSLEFCSHCLSEGKGNTSWRRQDYRYCSLLQLYVMRLFQLSWTLKHIRVCSSEICLCLWLSLPCTLILKLHTLVCSIAAVLGSIEGKHFLMCCACLQLVLPQSGPIL